MAFREQEINAQRARRLDSSPIARSLVFRSLACFSLARLFFARFDPIRFASANGHGFQHGNCPVTHNMITKKKQTTTRTTKRRCELEWLRGMHME
jgi:hypothetical protein